MLDFAFWCVVCLWLLYGWSEFRRERTNKKVINALINEVEGINEDGPQGKGPMGGKPS